MGKYTRKARMTVDVALVDVSQSYLGVRTRAKTLALQRLQTAAAAPPPSKPDACYLELRSRRLEKPMQQHGSRNAPQTPCACEGPELGSHEERFAPASIEGEGFGIEASFGENDLDFEAKERGTRESTPCSLIRDASAISPPGSTTKRKCSHAAAATASPMPRTAHVPSAHDLEEFFACQEQPLQLHLIEKYNFDFVSDLPLAGRYEWVAVRS